MTESLSERALNRTLLARQLLLERHELDPVSAIEHLAGMQAQAPAAPYVGLWSRLRGFERSQLDAAILEDRVYKCTVMRGTLHLVSAREFPVFRSATRNPAHLGALSRLKERGVDVAALQDRMLEALNHGLVGRGELVSLVEGLLPVASQRWEAWSLLAASGAVVNQREDALFTYTRGSTYRPAPPERPDPIEARRHFLRGYLRAFGPATRADFGAWSGQSIGPFLPLFDEPGMTRLAGPAGVVLHDLESAPRAPEDAPAPVRFLYKWDNILLAHPLRRRVLDDAARAVVIRKNGDVLPTFMVDGRVAGTWQGGLRGRARIELTALARLDRRVRAEVATEAERLLGWLQPQARGREVAWA